MVTTLAVFTRDLRVHDNPMLAAATLAGEHTVPLFVLDAAMARTGFATGARQRFLAESLADLDQSLRALGGRLVVRAGDPVEQVCRVADEVGAGTVHLAADCSGYAQRREAALRSALAEHGRTLHCHDEAHVVVGPGRVTPAGRDHYAVFGAYHRRWEAAGWRRVIAPPASLRLAAVDPGTLPPISGPAGGGGSAGDGRFHGGETAGRRRAEKWLREGVEDYDERRDQLAADATSRLSPYLHLGCLSALELATQAGTGDAARDFVRQLAWRDFFHQLLAARPAAAHEDYRAAHRTWRDDPAALDAWRSGHTGIPIVDAGMRQLLAEGWLPNRARMITASFLTKTLGLDWRAGAAHYTEHLLDADVANNSLNWQWVAGTGTDTRPGRVLNPLRQAERFDPDGTYVRRHVPELAGLPGRAVHRPWRLPDHERATLDYPEPLPILPERLTSEQF
ncbi:deoxyribodipyrimidine photo-lyase [Frankia sp. AgB1.9]|uniref:cryptochrome/photolyase family protein n=1 Tax=unclassified Frankia TaxID=2632575 RepID=UPI0035ABCCFC|nr:deoxyribodipyrimidine photo-lyase [Frankia sp. AgW1.1]MBL7551171.1 deoxyribodipyrimidine photo-lyase [Frankia sp. AgB1.9]